MGEGAMSRILTCIFLVLIIIFAIPFAVYSLFSFAFGLAPPSGVSPGQFLISILVIKVGTAAAFVLIFHIARRSLSGQWFIYAAVWWLMFVISEIGLAIGPNYTWMDALAGAISETLYFPVIGALTDRFIGIKRRD
jgi:hypothetical protein